MLEVTKFEEFIAAALAHFGGSCDEDETAFISGESLPQALRRWWGDVVQVRVVESHTFQWTCTGCGKPVQTEAPLYELPMFDHVLWDFCGDCGAALSGKSREPGAGQTVRPERQN